MTTSAISAINAQQLDFNSVSLLITNDRSHKSIDNCHQIDFKSRFTSDNVTEMLSNNKSNNHINDGKNESTKLPSDLMDTQHKSTESKINVLSNESQSLLKSNPNKNDKIKECIQQTVSEKTKKRITAIINEIDEFNDIEKLLLYIQLPNGSAQEVDPLKQKGPGNPFGKKADVEVAQTYTWIQSHLEEDPTVSLPKQEVYEEYKVFCDANKFEPLCVADFGKAMKHVFPKVKPRRLGQRGNSKYCYSGLRKKINIETPELPILDTSGYDSKKSLINLDLERNGVFSEKCLAETDVIISWATKQLDRSFDSITDLAQYLIGSNSVDISLSESIALKSTEDKQYIKSNSKSSNSSRRRDIQNQLQKKIQEKEALKEQKRKLDINNKSIESIKSIQNCVPKGIRKNRKNSVSKADEFESTASLGLQNSISIKTEPEIEISTNFSSNHLIQNNRIQNKVAIPRTVTPSRMSQPAISTSIILVPTATTVRLQASPQSAHTNESTATTTVSTITSPLKPNTSKYKRIQPKPVNICRSDSESAVCANNSSEMCDTFNIIAKRRHSVSVPFSKETKLKQIDSFTDKQLQSKRQIEERESSILVSKKRHIDNINAMVSNSTNSSGFDDANSSNSLSPISQELQTITSSSLETVGPSDIRINELESEALMDYYYFNPNCLNKEHMDVNNGNQTAQLSQLRKLLENHLPNTVNKTGSQRLGETVALEGYSELREALLRKNLNNTVQTLGVLNNPIISEQNSVSISGNLKLCPKNRQLESLITSPDLEGLSSLSDPTKAHSLSTNGDYFSNHSNELKNGFQHSVNLQVPSVPPSPTARRRAFNFQPISPRNTPTIPENCAIDTIGFNGFSYKSNTLSSSPQYRLNQQTVGVGPSQPSSEANSPFVSPRSTPVTPITPITPLPLSRSRHNSGQSNYSALRQTPQQNFDSGVSSISNSPFISPQSTPLPISRVRAGTGGMQRTISRVRHSSGPGGPITLSGITASLLCNRSNSLSPMIGDTFSNGTHGLPHSLPLNELNSPQFSFGSNVNPMTKSRTSNSPLSPIGVIQNSEINCMTSDAMNGSSDIIYNQECEPLRQNDWPSNRVKSVTNNGLVANRQRHASNPYNSPSTPVTSSNSEPFSREIFSYLKNSGNERPENEIQSNKSFIINRCQSVPVVAINSNMCFPKISNTLPEQTNGVDLENQLLDESTTISKSYPATPICGQSFQFPPSPPSSTKQQMAFSGDDIISGNVLQSGQDLMVSGVQLRDSNVWNTTIATQHNETDLMTINVNSIGPNSSNARRNLSDLLGEPPDDLQTTLEDLRDCDNDFSKFAQQLELEANDCTYDDLN